MAPRRRRDPSFWKALNRVLIFLSVCGAIVFVYLIFYPEVARRNDMSRQLDQKKEKLAEQELLRKQREREVYLLQNDPSYIEIIARDKLDLMKEGETIYRFDTPPPVRPNSR